MKSAMEAQADRLRTSAAKTKGGAQEWWAGVTATLQKRRAEGQAKREQHKAERRRKRSVAG
jgi:hypothetical protein